MKKRGGILFIIGIIFLIILIILAMTAIYFYNFHIFKTVRICIGNTIDFPYEICETSLDCQNFISSNLGEELNNAPSFLSDKLNLVIQKSFICSENLCYAKEIKGFDFQNQEIQEIENCNENEEEIKLDIRGKEALEIYQFYSKNNLSTQI